MISLFSTAVSLLAIASPYALAAGAEPEPRQCRELHASLVSNPDVERKPMLADLVASPSPRRMARISTELPAFERCVAAGHVSRAERDAVFAAVRSALIGLHTHPARHPGAVVTPLDVGDADRGLLGAGRWPSIVLRLDALQRNIHAVDAARIAVSGDCPSDDTDFAWRIMRVEARGEALLRRGYAADDVDAAALRCDLLAEADAWREARVERTTEVPSYRPGRGHFGPSDDDVLSLTRRLAQVAELIHRLCRAGPNTRPDGLFPPYETWWTDALVRYVAVAASRAPGTAAVKWPTMIVDGAGLADRDGEVDLDALPNEADGRRICAHFAGRDAQSSWLKWLELRWHWPMPPWTELPFLAGELDSAGDILVSAPAPMGDAETVIHYGLDTLVTARLALANSSESVSTPSPRARVPPEHLLLCAINGVPLSPGPACHWPPDAQPRNDRIRACFARSESPFPEGLFALPPDLRDAQFQQALAMARQVVRAPLTAPLSPTPIRTSGVPPDVRDVVGYLLGCHAECIQSAADPTSLASPHIFPPTLSAELALFEPVLTAVARPMNTGAGEAAVASMLSDAFRRIESAHRTICITEMPDAPCSPFLFLAPNREDVSKESRARFCELLTHGAALYLRAAEPGRRTPHHGRSRSLIDQVQEHLPSYMPEARLRALGRLWVYSLGLCLPGWTPTGFDATVGCE